MQAAIGAAGIDGISAAPTGLAVKTHDSARSLLGLFRCIDRNIIALVLSTKSLVVDIIPVPLLSAQASVGILSKLDQVAACFFSYVFLGSIRHALFSIH
jgi:hypothetical protein